jgi:hypothetical protein
MRGALVAQGLLGLCQRGIGLIERGARGVLLLAQAGQHALRGQTGVDFGLVGLAQGSEGRPARLGEGIGEIGPCGAGAGFVLARFALRVQGGASPGKGLVGGAGLAQGLVEIGGLPGLGGDVGGQGIVAVLKGAGLVARGDEIVAEQGLQGIGGMLPRAADRAGLAIVERRAHDLRGLIGGLRGAFMARAGGVEGGGKGGAFGLVGGDLRGEGLALGLARGEHSGVAGKGLRALVGLLPGGPGGGIGQHGGGEGLGAGSEGGEVFGAEVSGVGGLCLCQRGPGRGVPVFGLAPGLLRGVAGLLRGFDRLRQRAEVGVLLADPGPGGVVAGQEGRDLAFALGQRAQGGLASCQALTAFRCVVASSWRVWLVARVCALWRAALALSRRRVSRVSACPAACAICSSSRRALSIRGLSVWAWRVWASWSARASLWRVSLAVARLSVSARAWAAACRASVARVCASASSRQRL